MADVFKYIATFVRSYPEEKQLCYDTNGGLKEHIAFPNIKLDCIAPAIVEHHVRRDVPNLPETTVARER